MNQSADPGKLKAKIGLPPLRVFGTQEWLGKVKDAVGETGFLELSQFRVPAFRHTIDAPSGRQLCGARVGAVHYTDYLDFDGYAGICSDAAGSIIDAAKAMNLDYLLFSNVTRGSPLDCASNDCPATLTPLPCQSTLGVDTASGREAWWNGLTRNSRKRYKKAKRAERAHRVVLNIEPLTSVMAETFLDMQAERAKGASLDPIIADAPFCDLIKSLAGWSGCEIATMRIDGTCVAALLLLEYDRTIGIYVQAFYAKVASLSPGSMLFAFVIDTALSGRWDYVDFLRGEEAYKFHWANTKVSMKKLLWLADGVEGAAIPAFGRLIE